MLPLYVVYQIPITYDYNAWAPAREETKMVSSTQLKYNFLIIISDDSHS